VSESNLKALSRETKALIVVSEFEARRMPMFQMRAVLDEISSGEEEKKIIIDLVENDLKATGYHPNQISAFLQDLLNAAPPDEDQGVRVTRRRRSPFSMSFDTQPGTPPQGAPATPAPAFAPAGAVPVSGMAGGAPPPLPAQAPAPIRPAFVAPPRVPVAAGPLAPAQVPGLRVVGAGVRVSTGIAPANVPRPTVPMAKPPPGAEPAGTRAGVGKTGVPVDTAFFGSSLAQMALDQKPAILLADDDKRIRIVFRLCLERMGYRVVEAEDGNEAWKLIQQGGLTLVCLDMKMPGLHGLEVLTRMTNQQIDLPIIICSAYDQLKDEFIVATHTKLRYLVKPVSSEAMEKAVKDLIGAPKKA